MEQDSREMGGEKFQRTDGEISFGGWQALIMPIGN